MSCRHAHSLWAQTRENVQITLSGSTKEAGIFQACPQLHNIVFFFLKETCFLWPFFWKLFGVFQFQHPDSSPILPWDLSFVSEFGCDWDSQCGLSWRLLCYFLAAPGVPRGGISWQNRLQSRKEFAFWELSAMHDVCFGIWCDWFPQWHTCFVHLSPCSLQMTLFSHWRDATRSFKEWIAIFRFHAPNRREIKKTPFYCRCCRWVLKPWPLIATRKLLQWIRRGC